MNSLQQRLAVFGYFTFWVVYFFLFWAKALYYDDLGNLVAGHVNIWGDWAAHMTMGIAMGVRGPILESSPLIIGQPFAYPFVSNMISGVLFRLGFSIIDSFVFPSFLFSIGLVYSLFWVYKTFFKSRKIAIVASLIFLFNGGIGFAYFASDVVSASDPLHTLLNPPHEYTRYDKKGIKWISVIDSMVIPQRAFSMGFPLALIALGLIYKASYQTKNMRKSRSQLGIAGTLTGLLPIIHTHSFLALFIILACWSIADLVFYYKKKEFSNRFINWSLLALITSLLALPLIMLFLSKNVESGFVKWYPGWLARDFNTNWLLFWFKNWTIVPVLSVISWGLLLWRKSPQTRLFSWLFTPFFLIFVLANLFLFQPWPWDNTKLLVWSSFGFSGLVAYLLTKMWNHAQLLIVQKQKSLKLVVVSCFLLITASGMIDAYYIIRHDLHSHIMFSKEEVELAMWARENTATDSIWLTGDQHNHWLFVLTGRQALLTYRGWMWTHGYDYKPVEAAVATMFARPATKPQLFSEYNVQYIVIGPNELKVWQADGAYFAQNFKLIKQTQNYQIYQVETI